jgi:hypothetical protein
MFVRCIHHNIHHLPEELPEELRATDPPPAGNPPDEILAWPEPGKVLIKVLGDVPVVPWR